MPVQKREVKEGVGCPGPTAKSEAERNVWFFGLVGTVRVELNGPAAIADREESRGDVFADTQPLCLRLVGDLQLM